MASFFPLSQEQSSLIFLDSVFGPGIFHNNNYTLSLDSDVSYEDVRRAVSDLVLRHESLRSGLIGSSVFAQELGAVDPDISSHVTHDGEEPARYAERRAGELHNVELHARHVPKRASFEFVEDPDAARKTLLIATDHLVSDGISSGIVREHLQSFLREGRAPTDAPSIGYADLCRNRRAEGTARSKEITYWNRALGDTEPLSGLMGHTADAGPFVRTQFDRAYAGPQQHDALNVLASRHEVTPFAVLAVLVGCAIWRRTGRRKFVLHTPMSTRRDEQSQAAVGYFVNDRPVLCDIDPDAPLADALRRMLTTAWNAGRYSALSVPDLACEVPAYGASLLEHGVDYVQLHVWTSQVPSNRYRGPVDWQEETVHGPFTPSRDLRVTTLRYRFCPDEAFTRTFFAGPSAGIRDAVALSDDVLELLRTASNTDVTTIAELVQSISR